MINPDMYPNGLEFDKELHDEIRSRFANIDSDSFGKRIFFENSGGSLRLKACLDAVVENDAHPDCGGRHQKQADIAKKVVEDGYNDLRTLFGCGKEGFIATCLSASQVMFQIIGAITDAVPGKNIVVSVLEHPSGFDSVEYYAKKHGLELRVMRSNPRTGGIDVSEVKRLVDKDTVLMSCMYSCNITGAVMDIPAFVKVAREIKPELFIVVDCVQHVPHAPVDVLALDVDAVDIAPYKFFGCRGSGVAWLSERCAKLPHNRILCYPEDWWELGSVAPHQFAGYTAIVDYVCWIGSKFIESTDRRKLFVEGMTRIELHERALLYRALEGTEAVPGLRRIPGVKVQCDNPDLTKRDFILPITFDNIDPIRGAEELCKRGIYVYERVAPNHYSKRIVESLGLDGVIRVSPTHCNATWEVDEFLKAAAEVAKL